MAPSNRLLLDPIQSRLFKSTTTLNGNGFLAGPTLNLICKNQVPLCSRLSNGTSGFFLGAGGGSRTHFSHPFPGCLLRVATRCFCSPSPEPIGLRWTMPTPASFPRHFGPRLSEPYKLVEIEESLTIITIVRVSRSILRWLLV